MKDKERIKEFKELKKFHIIFFCKVIYNQIFLIFLVFFRNSLWRRRLMIRCPMIYFCRFVM
jgi:hypothetical protein